MVGGSADTDGFVGGVDIGFDAVEDSRLVSGFADSDLLRYAGWTKKNAQDGEVEGAVCGGGWGGENMGRVRSGLPIQEQQTVGDNGGALTYRRVDGESLMPPATFAALLRQSTSHSVPQTKTDTVIS